MKNRKQFLSKLKEKITAKRVIAGALVCALFLSVLPGDFISAGIAKAEGELDPANDVSASSDLTIYDDEYGFTVKTTDGQSIVLQKEGNTYQWPAGLSITQVQSISGQIAFTVSPGSTAITAGKYFKVKLPEVFSFDSNVYSAAQDCMVNDEGSLVKFGEFVINNKEFVFTFTNADLGKPGTSFEKTQVTFSASIDTEVLKNSETNSFSLAGSGGGNSIYIPPMPTTISALSESVEVSDKNELYWTVTLGKDEEIGADISGGKVTIGVEKNQEYQNKAYFEDAVKTAITFEAAGEDENFNYYTATLPEGTILSNDTRKITFLCYPTTAVMSPTTKDDAKVVFNSKSEFLKADAAEGESPYTANAQCELKRTSVTKTGEMLDGNRMKWTLTFNANEANVFAATLTDSMVEGLIFDPSYGVQISYDGGEETLTEAGKSYDVGDAKVVYNVTDNNAKGGQDFAIDFSDVFKKAYTISFATIVSDTAFAGDSEIRNALDVAVRYPTGGGSGNPVDYGVPEAGFQVLNGFIDIKKTSTTEEVETSGYLGWKVLPTTKMENTGYSSADVIITLGADGAQEFDESSLKITYDGSDLESTKYETDYTTENVLKITFTDASLDLNKVQITFNSKAKTYFASAAKKDYTAFADLTLHAEQDYSATQDKAFYSDIQNKMISETVVASYSDTNKELLFTFDIDVNHKKLDLTNVHVLDNVQDILHITSVNDDATYDLTVDEGAIPAEYVEVKKIIATVGEDVNTYAKDDETLAPVLNGTNIDVALGALNHTTGKVQIVVGLTAAGKEALNVGGALSKKVIFAKNLSSVTSDQTSEFKTAEIVSSKNNQIAINKVAVKDGTQDTSVVTWGIDINSLGADLGSSAEIVDTIPAGLSLNKDSVKLYKVSHSGIGTSISTDYKNGASANAVLVNASDYRTTIKKNRDNTATLTVYLPKNDNHASYGLVYQTVITGKVGEYSNELTMTVSTGSETAMKKVNVGAFSSGGVSRFALLTMKKTDAISGKAVVGAKYGIFESEPDANDAVLSHDETKAYDVGYTNTSGEITFLVKAAKKSATNYYVCELEAPAYADENGVKYDNDGLYQLDKTVYPIKDVFSGVYSIGADTTNGFKSTKAFTDQREVSAAKTGTVTLTNIFKDEGEAGKSSQFQLFVCPTGASSNKDIPVVLKQTTDGENGSYTFVKYEDKASATASYTEIGTVSERFDDKESRSTVTVTGLPWGTYCLKQKKTVDGYYSEKPSATFTLEQDELGKVTVKDGSDTTITDIKTKLVVTDNVPTNYVLKDETTGTVVETITGDKLTTTTGHVIEGVLITGHKYSLTQDRDSIPAGYKANSQTDKRTITSFKGNQTVDLTETPITLSVIVKDQDGTKITDAAAATFKMQDMNGAKVSGPGFDLNTNIKIGDTYTITGQVSDAYVSVAGASVSFGINSDGSIKKDVAKTGTSIKSATYDAKKNELTIVVYKIKGNVTIEDKDQTNNAAIFNGTYHLYTQDDAGNKGAEVTGFTAVKDEDGKTEIKGLPAGSYILKQDIAPTGYEKAVTEEMKFTISTADIDPLVSPDTVSKTLSYVNPRKPGTIKVIKETTIGDTNAIKGTTFALYKGDADSATATPYKTAVTNDSGVALFENLDWADNYQVKEIAVADGYQLNSVVHDVEVIDRDNLYRDVIVSDKPTKVRLKTFKAEVVDGTGNDLDIKAFGEEVSYVIEGRFVNETENKLTFTTDNTGAYEVANKFIVGQVYTVIQQPVEKSALVSAFVTSYNTVPSFRIKVLEETDASGYNKIEVVTASSSAAAADAIEVTNYSNRFEIRLENESGEALKGGEFEILNENGERIKARSKIDGKICETDTFVTDGSKKVEVLGLAPGNYTLKQIPKTVNKEKIDATGTKSTETFQYNLTQDGVTYAFGNESVDFTLGTETKIVKVVNKPTALTFNVNATYYEDCSDKRDTQANLEGIRFIVLDMENESVIFKDPVTHDYISSDATGKVTVMGLKVGAYRVIPMSALDISDDAYDNLEIKSQEELYDEEYTAELLEKLTEYMMDPEHNEKPIPAITDAYFARVEGSTFEGLYHVKDGVTASAENNTIVLDVKRGDIELVKTDKDDKDTVLEGSEYGLYRKKNFAVTDAIHYETSVVADTNSSADTWELVTTETTDENGAIKFEGVDVGVEYRIQELAEPSGYQVSKDPIFVRLAKDGSGKPVLESLDDGNGTANVAADGTVTWFEPRLKVAVKYVDEEDGTCIEGGTFEVVETDSRMEKHAWTTGDDWELISGKLTGGMSYTVVQTSVPQGYEPSGDTVFVAEKRYVSATDENKPQEIIIKARRKSAETPSGDSTGETPSDGTPSEIPSNTPSGVTPTGSTPDATPNGTKSPKTGDFWDFLYRFF